MTGRANGDETVLVLAVLVVEDLQVVDTAREQFRDFLKGEPVPPTIGVGLGWISLELHIPSHCKPMAESVNGG